MRPSAAERRKPPGGSLARYGPRRPGIRNGPPDDRRAALVFPRRIRADPGQFQLSSGTRPRARRGRLR
ncbi:MAG: hypothetical protein ACK559_41700, partial [bacterium]